MTILAGLGMQGESVPSFLLPSTGQPPPGSERQARLSLIMMAAWDTMSAYKDHLADFSVPTYALFKTAFGKEKNGVHRYAPSNYDFFDPAHRVYKYKDVYSVLYYTQVYQGWTHKS